jgi:hypothetical protein
MSLYLTNPNPELARLVARTPKGAMMHWAGSCSDANATCAGCQHYGFTEVIRNKAGDTIKTVNHPAGCALYYKYMKKAGKPLKQDTAACKYFESKQP